MPAENEIIKWFQKDFLIILVCLMSLLACVWTVFTVQSYQQAINEVWAEQWEASGCKKEYAFANITYNIGGYYAAQNPYNNT